MSPASKENRLLYPIVFLMAFCSLCYEFLIASKLSRLLSEGIFIYPTCLGVFILGMGLGSAAWYGHDKRLCKLLCR